MLPAATEMLHQLGVIDQVVAVSHECDVPESVKQLPTITSSTLDSALSAQQVNEYVALAMEEGRPLYRVDAERLTSLNPDLVVTQGVCDVCAVTPGVVEATLRGAPCVLPDTTTIISLMGTDFASVCADLRMLAKHTNSEAVAGQRIEEAGVRWRAHRSDEATKRVLLLEWLEPPYSPGHWLPEQIEAAGFVPALGRGGQASRAVDYEQLERSRPDAIGVVCCGFNLEQNVEAARAARKDPRINRWYQGPIVAFDANRLFSRPTLSMVDGAECLRAAFSGTQTQSDDFVHV